MNIHEEVGTAYENNDLRSFKALIKAHPEVMHTDGINLYLGICAHQGQLAWVQALIDAGSSPDDACPLPSGAIDMAASEGHFDVVRELLARGAKKPNVISAAIGGHLKIVKLLIKHGADPNYIENGMNALMHAQMYGHADVAQYLHSLGVRDVRDGTPPDYPASHDRLLELMSEQFGEVAKWQSTDTGEPAITLHSTKAKAKVKTVFTTGLSDGDLDCGNDLSITTELMVQLPTNWKLSTAEWPVAWLHKIARDSLDSKNWPHEHAAVFMNGSPPRPFAKDTLLCGWLCLRKDGAQYQMPDHRWVEVRTMIPIYLEEQKLIEKSGYEQLLLRFEKQQIPHHVMVDRPNLGTMKKKRS